MKGQQLDPGHKAWEIEAFYIAQAVTSSILMLSPKKVILGGGVMQQPQLYPLIREAVRSNLNGYVSAAELAEAIDSYIVSPGLGTEAGLKGALALGYQAVSRN